MSPVSIRHRATLRRNKLVLFSAPPDIYDIAIQAADDAGITRTDVRFTAFINDWLSRHIYRSLWADINETAGA